MKHSDFVLEG